MKKLINRIKRAVVQFQIHRMNNRYAQLNRDLSWNEDALKALIQHRFSCRRAVLTRRAKLHLKMIELKDA